MVWQELSLSRIVEQIPIAVAITHSDGSIAYANPRLYALLDEPAGSLVGRELFAFRPARVPILLDGERWQGESSFRPRSGEDLSVLEAVYPVRDADGVAYFIHFLQDFSAEKQRVESLSALAYYDSLSGLPNRNLFGDRLERALLSFERTGIGFAVLYIDLDRFKSVNDALGHAAGDRLLRDAAERMSRTLRKNDTLARLGGDEFAAVLEGMGGAADAARVAEKLLAASREPHDLGGSPVHVGMSIGIALCPRNARDAAALLTRADGAMYAAKAAGRNCCRLTATVSESTSRSTPPTGSSGTVHRLRRERG